MHRRWSSRSARCRENRRDQLKQADHEHGRVGQLIQRIDFRRFALVRGFDRDERDAEHDERDGNRCIVVEQFLEQVVPFQADNRRRDARNDDLAPQTDDVAVDGDGRAAVAALIALHRPDLVPEQNHDRENCAELNDDLEHLVERIRNIELHELVEQYHVARAADRQPLRDALHDTEQERIEPFHILNHW